MSSARCQATRKDGMPCQANAMAAGFCVGHDPTSTEARRRGGRASAKSQRILRSLPPDLAALWDRILDWLEQVEGGSMTARQAEALAVLVSRLLDLAKLASELGRAADLQERLVALEAQLAQGGA